MRMESNAHDQVVKELTLLLLYLNSWTEKGFPDNCRRSWKNHDFDILDTLADEELISDSKRAKSVYLYEDGITTARELLNKYGIEHVE